ncbi:MAG TPA: GNAT family N-acetyltransferase [Candidatus Obscuribacterales bacterium]
MTVEIRAIQPADDAAIAAIIRQVLTEYGANRPGFAWADPELDTLSRAYQSAGAAYYVATWQNTVIGGAGIAPFPCAVPALCELQKMYLLPTFRGQGIGRALLRKNLATAQKHYHGCYLETFDAMQEAITLYQKFGFERLSAPLGNSGHNSCNLFYLLKF